MSPHTQPSRQSGGSQGHPRILHGCPPTPSPPGSLEDPKGIPGSSLDIPTHSTPGSLEDPKDMPGSSLVVPTHTALHAVQRIPRTSQGLPGFLHTHKPPGNPEDPKDIPTFFLNNPTHIALQAVWRSPRRSQNPPWMSPHARYSRQSGGFQEYPRILPGC